MVVFRGIAHGARQDAPPPASVAGRARATEMGGLPLHVSIDHTGHVLTAIRRSWKLRVIAKVEDLSPAGGAMDRCEDCRWVRIVWRP